MTQRAPTAQPSTPNVRTVPESASLVIPVRRESQKSEHLAESRALGRIRSRSEVGLAFAHRAGRTRATETYQAGGLRVRVLENEIEGGPCAVLLNTGGGVLGGDQLQQKVRWGEGAAALVTNQAAEKIYRALDDPAIIETSIMVEQRARAEWLPQESIMFDKARLRRNTRVHLAEDCSFLGLEAIVFGRAAMNETVASGEVRDAWRIYRGGRLIFADVLHLKGAVDDMLKRSAVAIGARASAIIVFVTRNVAAFLPKLRDVLASGESRAAASAWNGLLVARLLAPDGETLKRDLIAALDVLRDGRDLPRVWSC